CLHLPGWVASGLGSGSPCERVPRIWAVLHRPFPGEHSSFPQVRCVCHSATPAERRRLSLRSIRGAGVLCKNGAGGPLRERGKGSIGTPASAPPLSCERVRGGAGGPAPLLRRWREPFSEKPKPPRTFKNAPDRNSGRRPPTRPRRCWAPL